MGWAERINPTAQAAKRGEIKPKIKSRDSKDLVANPRKFIRAAIAAARVKT